MSKVNVPFMLIYDNLFCRISQSYCIKLYCWIHTWKREDIISLSKVCLVFNFRSLVITGRTFGKVGKIHSNVAVNCQIITTFCILEKEDEINWIVCYIRCVHICLNIFTWTQISQGLHPSFYITSIEIMSQTKRNKISETSF